MLTAYRSACRLASIRLFVVLAISVTASFAVHADNIKVAFIGDQGVSQSARSVLELIRDEGAELLLIQGDLGYDPDTADAWIENIDTILGTDFPVLIVVGNHENYEWPKYAEWQKDKLERVSDIRCEGNIGVKAYCTYKTIGVVQVAPAIHEVEGIDGHDDYASYITDTLSNDDSTWRVCSWHKNMHDMQAGGKRDSTGWGVYQNCLAQGGLVLTGHEHSYSRTHLMSSFEDKQVIHTANDMEIGPGSSVAIVSGLGGRETRDQQHGGDWFASIYTATQGASPGSLFCTFNGDKADCYFKDVAGLVPDMFELSSKLKPSGESGSEAPAGQGPDLEPEPEQKPEAQEPETEYELEPEQEQEALAESAEQTSEDDSGQQLPDSSETTELSTESADDENPASSEPAGTTDAEDQSQNDPATPVEDPGEQTSAAQEANDPAIDMQGQLPASSESAQTDEFTQTSEPTIVHSVHENDEGVQAGIDGQNELPDTDSMDEQNDASPYDTIPTSIVNDGTTPLADSAPPPPLPPSAVTSTGSIGWLLLLALGFTTRISSRLRADTTAHA